MNATIVKTNAHVLQALSEMISNGEKVSKMIEAFTKPIPYVLRKQTTEQITVTSEKISFERRGNTYEIFKSKSAALIERDVKEGQYYFSKKNDLYWLSRIIEDDGIKYGVFAADGHTEGEKIRTPRGLFSENELPATKVIPLAHLDEHFTKFITPKFQHMQLVKYGKKLYRVDEARINKSYDNFTYICSPYKRTYKGQKQFDTSNQRKFTADQLK